MSTVPIRTLRAGLAAAVRRAGAGERTVVTVAGVPTAVLAPVDDQAPDPLARLVATGAVVPPRRTTRWRPPAPVAVWAGVRIDRALADLRG